MNSDFYTSFEMSLRYSRNEILTGAEYLLSIYLSTYLSIYLSIIYPSISHQLSLSLSTSVYVCIYIIYIQIQTSKYGYLTRLASADFPYYIFLQFPTGLGPSFGCLNASDSQILLPMKLPGGDLKILMLGLHSIISASLGGGARYQYCKKVVFQVLLRNNGYTSRLYQ